MDLSEKRERWSRMLAQAAHLAELDNTSDAVDRARACQAEVLAELELAADAEARPPLQQMLARVERRLAQAEQAHADWKRRVEERHDLHLAREQEVYDLPLPGSGID